MMQTFLPYPSFIKSAQVLDNRRLNKQIVEVTQILDAIYDRTTAWKSHPAVLMWKHYPAHLAEYGMCCATEYKARGYKVSKSTLNKLRYGLIFHEIMQTPPFLGEYTFHHSHQCNLLRKAPIYYGSRFPKHPLYALVPYVWWSAEKGFYTTK